MVQADLSGTDCCAIRESDDRLSREAVYKACRTTIREAIGEQVGEEAYSPAVIDGVPTIGKTRNAIQVAAEFDHPVAILTHRYETRDQHLELARDEGYHAEEIPALDRFCPTAKGEHGERLEERIESHREKGVSPKYFHYFEQSELPCMGEGEECPYLRQLDAIEDVDVVVGSPVHANLSDIIEDRILVFDEYPGDTFQRKLEAGDLTRVISEFFDHHEEFDIETYDALRMVAQNAEAFGDKQKQIRQRLVGEDTLRDNPRAIRSEDGHVKAPAAVMAVIELAGPTIGEEDGADWKSQLRGQTNLDYATLSDGTQAVRDSEKGGIILRQTPSLTDTEAVIGLDGTPVEPLWEGILGEDSVSIDRVLCDECRATYLTETLGYRFVQTTTATKPYSSGEHVNRRKDYGVIEAVASNHEEQPNVITTRRARQRLFEENPSKKYVDIDAVTAQVGGKKHYGNLRSSNDFAGDRVGIVLGSPHPGDRAIQITAALEGYTASREDGKEDTHYGIPGRPFLSHYRENKVAQAALRFGREAGATVYLHTSAVPKWLERVVSTGPEDVILETRAQGEREVIKSLLDDGSGTSSGIAERDRVTVGNRQVREILNRLQKEGAVTKDGTQPYTWNDDGLEDVPHTARVELPE